MARLGHKGRMLKRAGAALLVLIALAWGLSIPWQWWFRGPCVRYRALYIPTDYCPGPVTYEDAYWVSELSLSGGCLVHVPRRVLRAPETRWWVQRNGWAMWWRPVWFLRQTASYLVVLPLWIPFLLIAAPTALLWWMDRRRIPPHCCQECGYNLTGNVSGVCPECGRGVR